MSNLKKIREERGLSQAQLAQAVGIPKTRIQHYEQGFRSINGAGALIVVKIAQALNCKVEDLLETEEA